MENKTIPLTLNYDVLELKTITLIVYFFNR